jgi:hypothetical protein
VTGDIELVELSPELGDDSEETLSVPGARLAAMRWAAGRGAWLVCAVVAAVAVAVLVSHPANPPTAPAAVPAASVPLPSPEPAPSAIAREWRLEPLRAYKPLDPWC